MTKHLMRRALLLAAEFGWYALVCVGLLLFCTHPCDWTPNC